MKEATIYLLAIVIAEVVTVVVHPIWGMTCHILIFIVLIVHSAVGATNLQRPLLLSLALVPLVRIMSLSMPLADIPQIWWYPIIYVPLLVAAVVVMRILNYTGEDTGLTFKRQPVKWLPVQLVVALTGFIFGVAEYFILRPEPIVTELTWQAIWLPALVLVVFTGFVEELIFRGILQRSAVAVFRDWGIVYASLLFAILHIGFLSWIDVVFVFLVALFFGWVVKKTGSLVGVTVSHGITNILLFLVVPFLF